MFDYWEEGLAELTEGCCPHNYGSYRERIQTKSSQGKRLVGQSPGKYQRWGFCETICTGYCQAGKLTWAWLFRVFIGVPPVID